MKLQYTTRDLLWLAVVIGLAVGWLADRSQYRYSILEAIRWRCAAIFYLGELMIGDGWEVGVKDFDDGSSIPASKDGRKYHVGKYGANEVK